MAQFDDQDQRWIDAGCPSMETMLNENDKLRGRLMNLRDALRLIRDYASTYNTQDVVQKAAEALEHDLRS